MTVFQVCIFIPGSVSGLMTGRQDVLSRCTELAPSYLLQVGHGTLAKLPGGCSGAISSKSMIIFRKLSAGIEQWDIGGASECLKTSMASSDSNAERASPSSSSSSSSSLARFIYCKAYMFTLTPIGSFRLLRHRFFVGVAQFPALETIVHSQASIEQLRPVPACYPSAPSYTAPS